jgi:parallel beta-helix repeat protein
MDSLGTINITIPRVVLLQSRTIITILLQIVISLHIITGSLHSDGLICVDLATNDKRALSTHTPMYINSDDDFLTQGWSGNGSQSNPYLIDGLSFATSEIDFILMEIRNISSHFEIRNCSFFYENEPTYSSFSGYGINLAYSANGSIKSCTFGHLSSGVRILSSDMLSIVNNTFKYCAVGLEFTTEYPGLASQFVEIHNNIILFNLIGVGVSHASFCELTGNLIAYNTEIGIDFSMAVQNNIFNNTIAYNHDYLLPDEVNALDNGHDNQWDDNITLGNAWSDYSGIGAYNISGEAGSIDRFPTKAEFDLVGPEISAASDYDITLTPEICPFSGIHFDASVRDQSGVDRVILYYSSSSNGPWKMVELIFSPTSWDDYEYTVDFEGPFYSFDFIRYYYFWANDTIGLSTSTRIFHNTLYCVTITYYSSLPTFILISLGLSIFIVIVYTYLKKVKHP